MSGLPGAEPGATRPNWVVNAWNSAALDVLDYQWRVAAGFWRETDRLARDHDVKVALELHPQNLVFNSASVHKLIDLTGATNLGVELDASYWTEFLRALYEVDPDMFVNIEHEDTELGRVEGVTAAAEVLKAADAQLRESLSRDRLGQLPVFDRRPGAHGLACVRRAHPSPTG
jgi:sugar phosphate isomerase/epimerase